MKTMVYDQTAMQTLLANTLMEKTDSYTIQEILQRFPTLNELLGATENEFQLITGIGPSKARQLRAVLELGKMLSSPQKEKNLRISCPKDACDALKPNLAYLTQEHFVVIGLNTKHYVTFTHTVTIGTLNASLVHPREVFRPLLRQAAAACIVAHNHHSGDSTPSAEDITITKRLRNAGDILGIELLDHIVVGVDEYTSFRESGLL